MAERKRRSTSTSNFGVSRREGHDASAFYGRFELPELSSDDTVNPPHALSLDEIHHGSSTDMSAVADNSVALVVTSPPYYAGKAYEEDISQGHIPGSYVEYLDMLEEVFAECVRTLEPGGRIAINVANLGRRPYRSLSGDVTYILQDRLKLLLRGEIIWLKARGAGGNCAWGSFQQPSNPVLRDLSERIIVASKGRFDRAIKKDVRETRGLPSVSTIFRDEFLDFTTDIWEFPPESASRIGHPAPFPVELPKRLIDLYTYKEDLVLDPFMGSGTTAVAAVTSKRKFVGYDTDEHYVRAARERVAEAQRQNDEKWAASGHRRPSIPATASGQPDDGDFQSRAVKEGRKAQDLANDLLENSGFSEIRRGVKLRCGVEVNFEARDEQGRVWYFDVSGAFTSSRPGLKRTDTLWKAIGKATVINHSHANVPIPLVLLTTDQPARGSAGDLALRAVRESNTSIYPSQATKPVFDVIVLSDDDEAHERLTSFAAGLEPRRR
jgi:DNA modification methylase